ncbi:MAG: YoaK family protein [Silvibacterium sp.]
MRTIERDVMLFLLAISAGSADGWSYFGLGHAFVANMTGNTVLAGMAVFQKGGNASHTLLSIGCYAAGAAAASFFTRKVRQGVVWARSITFTLLLEALIMTGAATAWAAIHLYAPSKAAPLPWFTLLLGCVAFAIGLQSGAMLQLKVPGVVTTYITGTWTSLMSGLIRFASRKEHESKAQKLNFEERLLMQAGILVIYFLSAVFTGWLFHHDLLAVGALSAVPVLIVAVYAAVHITSPAVNG